MLRILALSDPSGNYYLDDPAREVTDVAPASSAGVWIGDGAHRLGLLGPVREDALRAVLRGQPPSTTLAAPKRRIRVGYDLIVAAPKCVSVLFASPDHDVARTTIASHHRALDAAVSYMEARALSIVRSNSPNTERSLLATDGAIAARFTHGISRSGDPHLHSHVLLANLAHGSDGRFAAVDALGLRVHAAAIDALYRSHLRKELVEQLSVRWQVDRYGREQIQSVSDATVLALSGRSAERRSGAKEWPSKVSVTRRGAEAQWSERISRAPEIEDLERRHCARDVLDEHHFASHLYGRTIRARDVVQAWSNAARDGIDSELISQALSKLVKPLGRGRLENPLLSRDVQPSPGVLRALGPRPLERERLNTWWEQQHRLERNSLVERNATHLERKFKEPDPLSRRFVR